MDGSSLAQSSHGSTLGVSEHSLAATFFAAIGIVQKDPIAACKKIFTS